MTVLARPVLFFRTPMEGSGNGKAKGRANEQPGADRVGKKPLIRCRQCLEAIARPTDRIAVNGAHRHAFANPHGLVYEIGCFRSVKNCGQVGTPTGEFTWFPGYSWRVAYCRKCLTHLGWLFEAHGGDRFHGLILKYIAESE